MADQEHLQTRVGDTTAGAVETYCEDKDYSEYVATGELVKAGLQAEGYLHGSSSVTTLQRLAGECVRFSAYTAAALIGVMLTTPLPLSGAVVSLLVTALGFTAVWNAEPRVSDAISSVRGWSNDTGAMADGGNLDGE